MACEFGNNILHLLFVHWNDVIKEEINLMGSTIIIIGCLTIILWVVFGPVILHDWQEERKQKQYKFREH